MTILLSLALYMCVLILISYLISRNQDEESFLIASRDRKWFNLTFSKIAGSIGAAWFITYTAFAYEFGSGVFAILISIAISYLIFGFYVGPKVHKISKNKKFLTIGDVVYHKTNSLKLKKLFNIFANLVVFFWLIVTIVGGSKLVSYFEILSYEFSVLIIGLVILVYILFSGYKGVIVTDIIQTSTLIILLILIAFGITSSESVASTLSVVADPLDIATFIGFMVYGIFSGFAFADRFQLVFSAKNTREVKKGFLVSAPVIFFMGSLLLLIGLFVRNINSNIDPSLVFLEAISIYLPESLLVFAFILFFAGIMSSADTYIYTIASHTKTSLINFKLKSDEIKVYSIVYSIIIIVIALIFRDIINLTIFAAGFSMVPAFTIIYCLYGDFSKANKRPSRAFFTLISSLIGLIVAILVIGFEPSAAIVVLIFGIIGLFLKSKSVDRILA